MYCVNVPANKAKASYLELFICLFYGSELFISPSHCVGCEKNLLPEHLLLGKTMSHLPILHMSKRTAVVLLEAAHQAIHEP